MPVNLLNEESAYFSPLQMLETKLLDYGLIPVEVGGVKEIASFMSFLTSYSMIQYIILHKSCRG